MEKEAVGLEITTELRLGLPGGELPDKNEKIKKRVFSEIQAHDDDENSSSEQDRKIQTKKFLEW